MAAPLPMVEPVGSGFGGAGRRGSRSGSKTSMEKTRTGERLSNEPDDPDEDNQWMPDHDPRDERGEFATKAQFLLTVIGFTVGNGTLFQFPLVMRNHGNASFLIMYFICMIVFGVPMLYLEMMIGQIAQAGPMRAFQLNFPLLQGVGWTLCFLSFFRASNYALLNSFSLEYAAEASGRSNWNGSGGVCVRIKQNRAVLEQLKNADSLKLRFLGFSRELLTMGILIFHIEPSLAPDDVASKTSLFGVAHRTICTSKWNSPACFSPKTNLEKCKNSTLAWFNHTCIPIEQRVKNKPADEIPAREFFRYTLRGLPASFDEGRANNNETEFKFESGRVLLCFCLVWIFACVCLLRRMKWLGKLSLFIVSFAGFLTFCFTITLLSMERSDIALQQFFKINATKFGKPDAWIRAFRASRTSLSLGLGGMISMASYNKRSNDAFWDSIVVCIVVSTVTLLSTMNIYIILAYCRHLFPYFNWQRMERYISGYMHYFIYAPELIATFKFSVLFSFLFFAVLLGLGITTFFGLLETPISALTDQFKFCRKHRSITIVLLCIVGFGVGLVQCTRVGYHIFYILDARVLPLFAEMMVGFQVITIACYGPANFYRDISASIGKKVNFFGYFLSPYGLLVRISQFILSPILMAFVYYERFGDYFFIRKGEKTEGVCKRKVDLLKTVIYLCNTLASVIFISLPIIIAGAVLAFLKHRKTGKSWRELLRPDPIHPSVRYNVPPPLGCIFGLKPIEAMPSAMGDDKVVEFPEKGIAPKIEEEAIEELR